MKLLTFQARRFRWESFARTLESAEPAEPAEPGESGAGASAGAESGEVRDAVVVWLHAERADEAPEAAARALRHVVKHVKWHARKRDLERVVLHSFAHLGGDASGSADPAFARAFLADVAARLASARFEVHATPFGHTCEWTLEVFGEGIAKVWKDV